MTTNTCPNWCTLTSEHDHDHWRGGTYVPASRSHPSEADMDGATIPAIAIHLAKPDDESSTDIVMHIGGDERDSDFEVRLSIDDTIAHLSHAAAALVDLFAGKSRRGHGCRPADLQRLDTSVRTIVDAYLRPDEQAKPIVYGEAEAAADVQRMTTELNETARALTAPGFFATPERRAEYDRAVLEADLPIHPTYGVVTWTVANGPHKDSTRSMFGTWAKAVDRQSDDPLARPTLLRCAISGQDVGIRSIQSWTKALVIPMDSVDKVLHAVPRNAPGGAAVSALNDDALDLSRRFLDKTGDRA